jgi:ribonuclease HII
LGFSYRIGADENGLGARLGPLVVTAVLAQVDESGLAQLRRKLPKKIAADLDDSKRLVSHADSRLGEAWARAAVDPAAKAPGELVSRLSLAGDEELRAPCPKHVEAQCWSAGSETFAAEPALVERVRGHLGALEQRGIRVVTVKSRILCTRRLNDARARGHNRFVSDLHAMEELVLALRREAGSDVHAVCGKVGGMGDYSRFFGPLGGWLHAVLEQGRARSSYRFPKLGELHFVRDADACDPLVMLASLIGKWLREILMARVSRYYGAGSEELPLPSGYSDPVTTAFVERTALVRGKRRVPESCFLRTGDDG